MNFKSTTFLVSQSDTAEQVFEQNSKNSGAASRARLYGMLTNDQRIGFKALPVERQMWLLQVPVKKQAQYKKNGVEHYLEMRETERDPEAKSKKKMTKQYKREEKQVTKAIKQGRPVYYE